MLRKSSGFTLVETLLVLTIVSGLAVLVTFQGQRHQNQLAEQAFWPSWQRMWTAGRQQALHRQEMVSIKIEPEQRVVRMQTVKAHQPLGHLKIPQTLQWRQGGSGWVIYPSGAATALWIEWYSRASHRWFYQTFQMGGAIFYVEATKTRRP